MRTPISVLRFVALAALAGACSQFGAVYPPRPPASPGPPVADPTPSRVVAHVTVTSAGLRSAVDAALPKSGDGQFALLKTQRRYTWTREPVTVSFGQGRVAIDARVRANIDMAIGSIDVPLDLHVAAEPVVNSDYKVKLQQVVVAVSSSDRRLRVADHVAGVFDTISKELGVRLADFQYDLKPLLEEAYARVSKPIDLPSLGPQVASTGEASTGEPAGCALLKVLGVEVGPTVVADGLEKDIALVVAPSVTVPCAAGTEASTLPPLANVAQIPSGPFTVTIPIAARYAELERAMGALFTDGKYFFSAEYPKLYLENPEIYESQGMLVLKMHLRGPVHKFGIDTDLDGDLFLSGHLSVVDNEVQIPDLEPTIETKNLLLSLKAMADVAKIRDQARSAMRLDLGERLKSVREKLSSELTFGGADACFHADLDKIEITSAHAHGSYLRVYVAVTARAAATMPCAPPAQPAPAEVTAR